MVKTVCLEKSGSRDIWARVRGGVGLGPFGTTFQKQRSPERKEQTEIWLDFQIGFHCKTIRRMRWMIYNGMFMYMHVFFPWIFWFFGFFKFKYLKMGWTVWLGLCFNVLREGKFTRLTDHQCFSVKWSGLFWSFLNGLISWPVEKSEVETSPSGRCSSPLQWSLQVRK